MNLSILTIGEVCKERKKKHAAFSFSKEAKEEIFRDILNLDVSKACQDTDIPSKIIKENADIFASFYTLVLIRVINSEFPPVLKQTNITPVFIWMFLSRYQCGFRKGYSTQQRLLAMLEKWRSTLDNKKHLGYY